MRPRRAIALGALLSCAVEFAQQWIPGRDPSTGDILCNSISTALGVALVRFAPRWLTTTPRRSAWQALATAVVAVLTWIGTGAVVRQAFPPPPYHEVKAPAFDYWARYEGAVLWSNFALGPLSVRAVAPAHPPDRESPLVAVLDARAVEVFILSMDGHDLALRYRMPAINWKLETPDLRWRGAFAAIAPGDTFTAVATYHAKQICLWLNDAKRCGFGYTIGDGWKLIFYPRRWPGWMLTVINVLWIAGCVIGVGFWAGSAATTTVKDGKGRYETVMARIAIGIVLFGLVFVPYFMGMKGTSLWEWIGALGGIEAGLVMGNRFHRRFTDAELSDTRSRSTA